MNLSLRDVRPSPEWVRLAAVAPVLLFPMQFRFVTLAVLAAAIPFFVAAYRRSQPGAGTPLETPAGIVGVMALIAAAISWWPEHSVIRLAGIVFGLLVMHTVMTTVRNERDLWRAVGVFLILGVLTVTAGLLGTAPSTKFATLWTVSGSIPRLVGSLPGTDGSVNTNGLAGTTLFFLPLAAVLLAAPRVVSRALAAAVSLSHRNAQRWVMAGLIAAALCFGTVLLLSQSRTGWMSAAAAAALLIAWAWRPPRLVLAAAVLGVVLSFSLSDPAVVAEIVRYDPKGAQGEMYVTPYGRATSLFSALSARSELWTLAIEEIRRFPLTGAGLNVFRFRIYTYPPMQLTNPDRDVAHAHNTFLQVALDTGIPGLVAYLALLLLASAMCHQVWRTGSRETRVLALGLWGNLAGVHVFGLGDAIALGAKVGIFLWWNFGLIAALYGLHVARGRAAEAHVIEPVAV